MARYFFHVADGRREIDDEGIELAGDAEARREAVRYGGNILADEPDMLLTDERLQIHVTDERGEARFAIVISAVDLCSITDCAHKLA